MNMNAKQIVTMALAKSEMSKSELARRLNWSPQLLNSRLQVGKFTLDEWEQIGNAIGAETYITFHFDDGTEIKTK